MRRILRKIAANKLDELGDTSTLADPAVVQVRRDTHRWESVARWPQAVGAWSHPRLQTLLLCSGDALACLSRPCLHLTG